MAENTEQAKKKVYVEATVISDATALPVRDIVQLGRQVVERICKKEGYACPCICTPQMLQEGGCE